MQGSNLKGKENKMKISYLNNFSDAILAATIVLQSGTHFTTWFGSERIGEWILTSWKKKKKKKRGGETKVKYEKLL